MAQASIQSPIIKVLYKVSAHLYLSMHLSQQELLTIVFAQVFLYGIAFQDRIDDILCPHNLNEASRKAYRSDQARFWICISIGILSYQCLS